MNKKMGIFIGVFIVFVICISIPNMLKTAEQHTSHDEEDVDEKVAVVFDCSKYSLISAEELTSELGEPKTLEDWNNITSKGEFPMQIYCYDFEDSYGEFITYEDTVVKIHLISNSEWKIEGSNFNNIFTMFGIEPNEKLRRTVYTGATYKFSPVSDSVAEAEFFGFNKDGDTFNIAYFTYDLSYFD